MEKIKALLVKAGCNEELVGKICESLDAYKNTVREQYTEEYAGKLEEAKKVCIEETEAHKRELAKRLQIFCETKGAAIEAQLAKQSALNESAAYAKLQQIHGLLSGVNNSAPNGDVTATMKKAKQQVKVATEAKQKAVSTANRQTAIAEKALKQNRELSRKVSQLERTLSESRQTPAKKQGVVSEGKNKRTRRIDQSRGKSPQPVSTRATITENQDRRPAPQRKPQQDTGNGFGVGDIAANMDEDLV
jgi:hypothetical protein